MELTQVMDLKQALKKYFGFDTFRGNQQEVIESILTGRDTFVLMPTGGGKSLCYQLPAILSEGTAIVVSPLIALMKNQVDLIRGYSENESIAHFINSSIGKKETRRVQEDIKSGVTKVAFIAPETLGKREMIDFFKGIKISFVAIDEAHCISEWGHDFRPEYRKIRSAINQIQDNVPFIALTATATQKVKLDIIRNLKLKEPNIFISSFNRANLYYDVRIKAGKDKTMKDMVQYIKKQQGKSGIIYCLSRKTTQEISQILRVNGIKAAPYHAGLDAATRAKHQDQFLSEDIEVMVATIAFGMGIDKPDVRFVIHYNVPKSLENYYQETGRAGRDGLGGDCVTYYGIDDILKLEKFLKDKPEQEKEIGSYLITDVVNYMEASSCRRKFLLHYFGEDYNQDNCDKMCDNCRNPVEKQEVSKYAVLALKGVIAVSEKFDTRHVVNVLMGRSSQKVKTYNHHELDLFGEGDDKDKIFWNSVMKELIVNNYLEKNIEKYGEVRMSEKGRAFIENPSPFMVALDRNIDFASSEPEISSAVLDNNLLELLKDLRKKIAKQKSLPPFVIFQDASLEDMATQYPINKEELTKISGVSKGKADKYGKEFVVLIASYVEENDIDRPDDFIVKTTVNKSGLKVYLIQNIDKRVPFEEMARVKGIETEEIIHEIESIVSSGTKLNINYYIEDMVDEELQDIIYDYFREAETDSLDAALDELEDEGATAEDIQLMRIKFMSEVAN